MKPADIRVGKTYRNRGKGKTTRTVLRIDSSPLQPLRVDFRDNRGREGTVLLTSFARWAGEEVAVNVG